jgi:hypothetical protein
MSASTTVIPHLILFMTFKYCTFVPSNGILAEICFVLCVIIRFTKILVTCGFLCYIKFVNLYLPC